MKNSKGETPSDICTFSNILELLGSNKDIDTGGQLSNVFVPSYIKNAPLNAQIELGPIRIKQPDLLSMPNTSLPATQTDGKHPSFFAIKPQLKLSLKIVNAQSVHILKILDLIHSVLKKRGKIKVYFLATLHMHRQLVFATFHHFCKIMRLFNHHISAKNYIEPKCQYIGTGC